MIPGIANSTSKDTANQNIPRLGYSNTANETQFTGTGATMDNVHREYIAHGSNGQVLFYHNGTTSKMYYADSVAKPFTRNEITGIGTDFRGCWSFDVDGVITWVISNSSGNLWYTTGALTPSSTWTLNTMPFSAPILRLFYNPSSVSQKWFAVGKGDTPMRYAESIGGTWSRLGIDNNADKDADLEIGCQAVINGVTRYIVASSAGGGVWVSPVGGSVIGSWITLSAGSPIDIGYGDGYVVTVDETGASLGSIRVANVSSSDTVTFTAYSIPTHISSNPFTTTLFPTMINYQGGIWTIDSQDGRQFAYNKGVPTSTWTGGTNGNINPTVVCRAPYSPHSMYMRWGQGSTNQRFYYGI